MSKKDEKEPIEGLYTWDDYERRPVNEKRARRIVRRTLETMLPARFTPDGAVWQVRWERVAKVAMILSFLDDDADDDDIDDIVKNSGHDDYTLRMLCARQLERTLPPSRWRDYAVQALQRPDPPGEWELDRGGIKVRDRAIRHAVEKAYAQGLFPTRNQATRDKGGAHSACSLVAEELKRLGIRLSEDAVEKIFRKKIRKPRRKNNLKLSYDNAQNM
jgi:hypothetical protein